MLNALPKKMLRLIMAGTLVILSMGGTSVAARMQTDQEAQNTRPTESASEVLTVAPGNGAMYTSIQAAIDGATIRIAPGIYTESIIINKAVTLMGAGWNETTIASTGTAAEQYRKLKTAMDVRLTRVTSVEQGQAIQAELKAKVDLIEDQQALLVSHANGVIIRNLTISSPGAPLERQSIPTPQNLSADTQQTLRDIYEDARKLAQAPDHRDQAIAKYRAVLEIHQSNERVFEAALRELARCYEDAGLTEEHIRFFMTLAYQRQGQERQKALGEIFNRFGRKQPELVQKIVAEIRGEPDQEARARPPVPSQDLVQGILQREDTALRETSLAKLRGMLARASATEQKQAGLVTLRMSLDAKFDRTPFLSLVLPLLKSDDDQVRTLALTCIPALNATAENLAQVMPLVQDKSPEVRSQVGGVLKTLAQGKHPDQVIPALTTLLKDSDPKVVERTLRSMWGLQHTSPELDARLIQLSRDPQYQGTAVYYCLSTMRTKSVPVCKRLIEVMQESSSKRDDRARSAWGLTYGVVEDAKPYVEAGMLTALPEETDEDARKTGFRALRLAATEKSRPFLNSVLASDMESEEYKQLAREILQDLDQRVQ
ncbi:MAG: hypothetical protein K9N55_03375 [Phycisphaerae bacterium]|nr:hypothetical protein [Phycisphaerae bacterium]